MMEVTEQNTQPLVYSKEAANIIYYDTPEALLQTIPQHIMHTDVVLDIGCGIYPIKYFQPKLHIMVEPYSEYVELLQYQSEGDKGVLIIQQNALEAICSLGDNSVDSIFLLDVIEHIKKDVGLKILEQCERVARQQIIVFTPLGFMPQPVEPDEKDAWGLSGGRYQEHVSGWTPDDFDQNWQFHVCNIFHEVNNENMMLENPYGAFYSIKKITTKPMLKPRIINSLKIPFCTTNDIASLSAKNNELEKKNKENLNEIKHIKDEMIVLQNKLIDEKINIESFKIKIDSLKTEISEKEGIISEKEAEIKKIDTKNGILKLKIDEKTTELQEIEHDLILAINSTRSLEQNLERICKDNQNLHELVVSRDNEIQRLHKELNEKKIISEALRESYTSFLNSKSIRLVLFLRKVFLVTFKLSGACDEKQK